jgi:uncharacterized protein YjbJ (UPF0337 family)
VIVAVRFGWLETRVLADDNGSRRKDIEMGLEDKIKNAAQDVTGKIKEAVGKSTNDESLEAEGRGDQAGADLKQAGEKVKDAFKN